MENKKRPNVFLYTILMAVIFLVITELVVWGYGGDFVISCVMYGEQGYFVISEAVLAGLIMIVMLAFGNDYVFTQKKAKLGKGLFYGIFYLVGAVIFAGLYGVMFEGFLGTTAAVFNILIGCLFVGAAEEFLCRGWLLNEFLERFGDSKKGIWYSIVVSGLFFGLMHIGNYFNAGQNISTTIIQIISAAATGVVFGLIYYKTKNIWSMVLLHAVWDFSLYVGEAAPVYETQEIISSLTAPGAALTLLMAAVELLNILPYMKDIDREPKKSEVIVCGVLGFLLYFCLFTGESYVTNKVGETYEYDTVTITDYSVTYNNYSDYYMDYLTEDGAYEDVKLDFGYYEEGLLLSNELTGASVSFDFESLYDYSVLETEDYFVIAYTDYRDGQNPWLYYNFVDRASLTNDDSCLEEIRDGMHRYLLSDISSQLVEIYDRTEDISYLAAYSSDYGCFVLTDEEHMAVLE